MATKQRINSNFYEIAVSDANGDIVDAALPGNLIVDSVANLNAIGNVRIPGGNSGDILMSNGAGGVTWGPTPGAFPGGVNTNVQFNNAGNFAGSNAFTWNNVSNTMTVTNANLNTQMNVLGVSRLGSNANVKLSGGTSGQILTTNGSGALSWTTPPSGVGGALVSRWSGTQTASSPGLFNVLFGSAVAGFSGSGITYDNTTGLFTNSSGAFAGFKVSWCITFAANSTGIRQTYLTYDPGGTAPYWGTSLIAAVNGGVTTLNGTAIIYLPAPAGFYIKCSQTSLVNLAITNLITIQRMTN